jgi:uroporphyrinogen-III synthase
MVPPVAKGATEQLPPRRSSDNADAQSQEPTVHHLLLTRARAQSERFAALVADLDVNVVISPLFQIVPVGFDADVFDGAVGVIVTSENAIAQLPMDKLGPGLVAYCVGTRTCEAARSAGLRAFDGGGTAEILVANMLAQAPQGRLIYLRGTNISAPIAVALMDAGLNVTEVVAYDQQAWPFSDDALALLSSTLPVIAPIFSERTARLFVAATGKLSPDFAHITCIAISATVAKVLQDSGFGAIYTADAPNRAAMLTMLRKSVSAT